MTKKTILLILILVAAGFFIYFFNLQNPLFWDDDDWIINNTYVHNITWDNVKFWFTHNTLAGVGLKSNYYRPFLFFTFAVNYVMAGIKPLVWHLMSNLIHIANGILVFLLLNNLRTSHVLRFSRWVAFLAASIFVIHPLQTEAVTYISGRGDLLVAFLMLLALWLLIKHKATDSPRGSTSGSLEVEPLKRKVGKLRLTMSQHYWPISIGLLVLALFSRETAIIFPFLAMLVLITLSQDKFLASLKKSLKTTAPFFAVVIVYGILRLTVLNFQNTLNFYPVANVYSESLMARLYTFGGVLIDYVRLLFVPVGLHMERGSIVYTSLAQWPVWGVFLALVGLVIFLVYLYRKERRGQSYKFEARSTKPETIPNVQNVSDFGFRISDFRILLFGFGWFFVGLAPVSGITPINAVMYEHWLYLPMIGFWFVAAFYLAKLFQGSTFLKIQGRTLISPTSQVKILRLAMSKIVIVGLVAYFSFFVYQSIQRNILWGKPADFYKNILEYEPDSTRVNNNLGNLYFNQGDLANAEKYYEVAATGDDSFPQPHFNLGSILESRGDTFGAIKKYERAIEVDPNFYYAHQNLMALYARTGDLAKAVEYVEILKKLKPQDPRVFYNAALIYVAINDRAAAVSNLKAGLLVADADPYAKGLIEELLSKLGR